MIDPVHLLAFAVQTHPGIYALLLGSGVSRASGIPTGWEIVIDLIRKLAAADGDSAEPDPEQWYFSKFGESPDYSKLMNHLAKTPTERQQLLRPYFEPTGEDGENGLKQPTNAHKAIAYLVKQGFIKLIITTNFDRLIEKALEQEGIAPEIISTKDQLVGSVPLTHVQCRLFKLHGDYLDPGILNTPEELAYYSKDVNDHLDRILDDFGLIVCGWSADWDIALGNAIERAPNRRFTTYWATRGQPTETAKRLITRRHAEQISITSADDFFDSISEAVQSLQKFSRPHPLSNASAVESLKRYLPNPEHRIRLNDLIDEVTEQVNQAALGEDLYMDPNKELVSEQLKRREYLCSTLLSMSPIAGYWAEDYHYPIWERTLQHLTRRPALNTKYNPLGLAVANHPARLTFYALAMGAIASEHLQFLNRLFRTEIRCEVDGSTTTSALLALFSGAHPGTIHWEQLLEGTARIAPFGQWIHRALRENLRPLIQDDERYDLIFDQVEVLGSLGFPNLETANGLPTWFPFGTFLLRPRNGQRILDQLNSSILEAGPESLWVKAGIFGESPQQCQDSILSFKNFFNQVPYRFTSRAHFI